MSRIGTFIAIAFACTAMFALAFVGVAKAKGASVREMPPVAWFVEAPPHDAPSHAAPPPMHPTEPAVRREKEPVVAPMTAGVLGAFILPSPFDSRELQELQRTLVDRVAKVEAAEKDLARRASELDDWQRTLEERAAELDALRGRIEKGTDGPAKTDPAATADAAKDEASWRAMASLFADGDVENLAAKLATFAPEEAALVLQGLEQDRAAELLNALPKSSYKPFFDAWRRARD